MERQLDRAEPATGPGGRSWTDEAIVELWSAHRRWVAAVIYAHKPREADLGDLLQEVAMKLVKHIHTLEDEDAIRPWLRTVAINVARSAGRSARSRARREKTADVERIERDNVEPLASIRHGTIDRSTRHRGRLALSIAAGLPPHYREPLLLNLRGLSHRQISRTLELPVTTIETRLIRARRMIRDELVSLEAAASNPVPASESG